MRQESGDRSVVGIIVARSSEVPALPDDLVYTVEVDEGGVINTYTQVKPGLGYRPTDRDAVPDDVLLMPFMVDQVVPVAIRPRGAEDVMDLLLGEHIDIEECVNNGP